MVNLTRSTIAVDPQDSKVKEQDISLTKKFCITISIQKISSIHKFIIKIQQFLGYHELKKWSSSSKIIKSTFSFPEFAPAWKKSLYSICSFLSSVTRPATSILTMPTKKNFHQLLIFVIMYQHAQNQFILFVHSSDTVPSPDWPHLFLTMLTPKIFNHLLICVKLYQHAKNQLITSVLSWDTVSFTVQRPD